jgi:NTE family protein
MSKEDTKKKKKIGVALSGGGTRGVAHLGALKALEEADLKPEVVAGVSAGAIAGGLYASGLDPETILDIFIDAKLTNQAKFSLPHKGLLSLGGMENLLKKHLEEKKIEDFPTKFFAGATNLNKAEMRYFDKGEAVPRIIASASIPILFSPKEIEDDLYVDGGVMNNLPVTPLQDNCDFIIGILVSTARPQDSIRNAVSVAKRVFQLSVLSTVIESVKNCDIVVRTEKLSNYDILDNSKAKKVFKIGYEAAKQKLEEAGY